MKKVILIVAGLMVLMNIILSLVFEDYSSMAMLQGCAVVVINAVILLLVQCLKLSDAYRYSLNTLFTIVTIAEWIMAFFAPNQLTNNWFVVASLVILILEVLLLIASNSTTNIKLKNK
ncbi:MAG: hypothetical protein KBT20_07630 [Bacteroidales bacterium]|nr:hypothetical protein [Candidatus Liminaster caballi]